MARRRIAASAAPIVVAIALPRPELVLGG